MVSRKTKIGIAWCTILTICLLTIDKASASSMDTIRPPRPKVGVVLGGGGAKGAAHIGVLKYIEEMGIPVDYVAGTSMGSIIGGLYAMGYSPDELAKLISEMNWSEYVGNSIDRSAMSPEMRQRNSTMFMNIPFSLSGLIGKKSKGLSNYLPSAYVNNTALINLFNDLCVGYQEETDFNELPIPFACVATDMATGKEIVIRHGSVPNAMRASMAIPGVFSPVQIDGRVLVDGGLVNNFPADVLKRMGADIIIGVEVNEKRVTHIEDIPSLPDALSYLLTNAVSSKREENRKLCTLYLNPDISGYGMLSFSPDAIDTLVKRGYNEAVHHHEQLERIKDYVNKGSKHPAKKILQAPKAKNLKEDSVYVSAITINQVNLEQGKWLAKKGGLKVGQYLSAQEIEQAVEVYRGTGAYNDITYNLYETEGKHPEDGNDTYQLVLNFKPTLPHVIGIGTRYDTEDGAAMLINLGLNEKRLSGLKFNITTRLSYNYTFNATATYALIPLANFNIAYDYQSQSFRIITPDQRKSLSEHYLQHQLSAYISQFQIHNINSRLGFVYSYTYYDQIGEVERLYGPFFNAQYDVLDHSYFARSGFRTKLNAHLFFDPDKSGAVMKDVGISYEHYLTPGNSRITFIPQLYGRLVLGNDTYLNMRNIFGGEVPGRHSEFQMPFIGMNHVKEAYDLAAIGRLDLRYNIFGSHYITGTYNLLFEYDIPENKEEDPLYAFYSGIGLRYSYNSVIGPIGLTTQWSNYTNEISMYLSIGYNF